MVHSLNSNSTLREFDPLSGANTQNPKQTKESKNTTSSDLPIDIGSHNPPLTPNALQHSTNKFNTTLDSILGDLKGLEFTETTTTPNDSKKEQSPKSEIPVLTGGNPFDFDKLDSILSQKRTQSLQTSGQTPKTEEQSLLETPIPDIDIKPQDNKQDSDDLISFDNKPLQTSEQTPKTEEQSLLDTPIPNIDIKPQDNKQDSDDLISFDNKPLQTSEQTSKTEEQSLLDTPIDDIGLQRPLQQPLSEDEQKTLFDHGFTPEEIDKFNDVVQGKTTDLPKEDVEKMHRSLQQKTEGVSDELDSLHDMKDHVEDAHQEQVKRSKQEMKIAKLTHELKVMMKILNAMTELLDQLKF